MEHVPTTESYIKKVIRIAKELDISIDKAGITCDAFTEVFSDLQIRQAIFGMVEQLDEEAVMKGEPLGLIINYGVVIDRVGIRVSRYADEIPEGKVVTLTPPDQVCIFLQIKDDFPTQEVLGPMVMNRPELESVPGAVATGDSSSAFSHYPSSFRDRVVCTDGETNELPSLAKEGCQPVSADGVVCSSDGITQLESPTELPKTVICLGPIRLKFNERFPFVSAAGSRRAALPAFQLQALNAHLHLPPWAAITPAFQSKSAFQPTSGLSPPPTIGERGHSVSKDVPWHWH